MGSNTITEEEYWKRRNMSSNNDRKANIGRNEYGEIYRCLTKNPCYGPWLYMCPHGHYCQRIMVKRYKRSPL